MDTRTEMRFPYGFDSRGRTATAPYAEHVREMVEQLLLTTPGERVNRPEFGGGLLQLVFAPNSAERVAAVEFTLSSALERWLGDVVDVQRLAVTGEDARLLVELEYVLRSTGERRTEVVDAGVRP